MNIDLINKFTQQGIDITKLTHFLAKTQNTNSNNLDLQSVTREQIQQFKKDQLLRSCVPAKLFGLTANNEEQKPIASM